MALAGTYTLYSAENDDRAVYDNVMYVEPLNEKATILRLSNSANDTIALVNLAPGERLEKEQEE